MSLTERLIKSPYIVVPLLLAGVVLGIKSFKELPVKLFPDANYPRIVVLIRYSGASAEDVEKQITIPVEREIAKISMVRRIRSVSRDGVSVVSADFEYEKGLQDAHQEVAAALDRIREKLPHGIQPRIYRVSDATTPVMTVAFYPKSGSGLDLAQARRLVEEYILPAFLKDSRIGSAEVFGGEISAVEIDVDQLKLAKYGLSVNDVIAAVSSASRNLPSGIVRSEKQKIIVKIPLERERLEEIMDIPLRKVGLHLKDVAQLRITHLDRDSIFRGNGIDAVGLSVMRPEGGGVMSTIRAAEELLPRIMKRFPQLSYKIVDTQKDVIATSMSNLVGALRDAVLLTVIVIFIFMARFRATLLTAISIPATYFLTFFFMKLFGMELNIVTMTGVILAVGLLVDDSIVVAENIERHLRAKGLSPKEAAITGTSEIMLADLSGTLTTVLVLIPIMFIGGYVEKILKQLASVLVIALLCSYAVSITLIPLLSPYLLSPSKNRFESWIDKIVGHALERLQGFYIALFRAGSKRAWISIPLVLVLFAVSVRIVMPLVGRDLMPPMDTGILKVKFELYPNTPAEEAARILDRIETRIKRIQGVVRISSVVGSEPDAVSFGLERTPTQGMITVQLVDRFHRKESIWKIADELQVELSKIPDLKYVDVYEFGATPLSSISAPFDVMLSGLDPKQLHRAAVEVERRLKKIGGLVNPHRTWDYDRLEFRIVPDLEKLALYGITPEELSRQIETLLSGRTASFWRIPEEKPHPIVVRATYGQRRDLQSLMDYQIETLKGPVPLRELAHITAAFVRPFSVRENLLPVADVVGYRRLAAITHIQEKIEKALADLKLPSGVFLSHEGEIKQMKESFGRLKKALVVSLILLYFSLVPTFRSFKHPLTIMAAIPLSIIGAAWALLLTGRHFCMPASMGMILLAGVVVNNSILLIDFIERARKKGLDTKSAVEESIKARTRPILMTALSTIVGMLPIAAEMAVGLERLSPLAVVAIGGLLAGTFLTLVYIPILYTILDRRAS